MVVNSRHSCEGSGHSRQGFGIPAKVLPYSKTFRHTSEGWYPKKEPAIADLLFYPLADYKDAFTSISEWRAKGKVILPMG